MKIDWKKPVQTKGGVSVRILCIDAAGEFPVIGLIAGQHPYVWTRDGIPEVGGYGDEDSLEIVNSPPKEKFYISVKEDGSYQSDVQGLTHTPTDMAQITVDPEGKTIHIVGLNDTEISIDGVASKKPITQSSESQGDLMSGYFKSLHGREPSSIMLNDPVIIGEVVNDE